jgi:hypothetical protein
VERKYIYFSEIERFGYTLQCIALTEEECKKAMVAEYVKVYKRENGTDPEEAYKWMEANKNRENIEINAFKCRNNESLYSYFYQCFNSEEFPSKESALQFSGTMNTKSIYFPFNQDLYNFYIEIWFHTDLLTQEDKPLYTKYFFATNNHHMYYDINTQQFTLKVYNEKGVSSTFNLMQKIYYFGWNHLIFYSHENVVKDSILTTFTVSLANNLIDVGTIEGRSTANKICFCNKDTNCCDRLTEITWMDIFIKEIKVWYSNFAQYYTINDYDKYNFIIPGGLLQMYNLTAASLDQNIKKLYKRKKYCDRFKTS